MTVVRHDFRPALEGQSDNGPRATGRLLSIETIDWVDTQTGSEDTKETLKKNKTQNKQINSENKSRICIPMGFLRAVTGIYPRP